MLDTGEPVTGRCDVVVVGGGPAGSAAAIRLADKGFAVVLLDRPARNAPRVKLGETLPPHGRRVLQRLGVWEAFTAGRHLPSTGITSYWGSRAANENDFLFNPHGCGWSLDRERFDASLLAEAERRGVRILRGARMQSCAEEDTGEVRVRLAAGAGTLCASFIIDATGRAGAVRRALSRARGLVLDRLVGLACNVGQAGDASNLRTLIEATELGWWYSAPMPRGGLVAIFMTDADFVTGVSAVAVWRDALDSAAATAERVKRAANNFPAGVLRVASASSFISGELGGNCWAAVGDAAMAWDPLSSQGVCKALESGLDLADAYEQFAGGDQSALQRFFAETRETFSQYVALRAGYYAQEIRWPESPFWRRRNMALSEGAAPGMSAASRSRFS